jgi:reactive intermediate/imine deaminase
MTRQTIETPDAPRAIGPYSQAIRAGNTVYLSGQIALDPGTQKLIEGGVDEQAHRVFDNLKAVAQAAGGSLANAVRLTIYLTDLGDFARVNEIMAEYFQPPYPARATVGVAVLPRGARVEIDAVLVLD